jgi:hypothetical protein
VVNECGDARANRDVRSRERAGPGITSDDSLADNTGRWFGLRALVVTDERHE